MIGMLTRRVALVCALATCAVPACSAVTLQGEHLDAPGNPILADGSGYSADPAPLVADGKLYIVAGRDTAAPDLNAFDMPGWQMFVSSDPASGQWTHYRDFLQPQQVFAWAEKRYAYAAQIVQGPDRRYYLYAPVQQRKSTNQDPFAIGVAVSDSPLGPWTDVHPQGPVVSQSVPTANTIQNIDPTVLVDDDGRVYLYWGTFGALYGVELQRDMVSFKGSPVRVDTLEGYFEAPWLFKRNGSYYLAYAANNAGRRSACTPTRYHACIAYASAPTPLGPWTYRGIVLPPVSSTTSHPGIVAFKGQWYLVYHTADAHGGGHFRRSVAIDRLEWDDTTQPASIRPVIPTRRPVPPTPPQRNQAPFAYASASNGPDIPVQYWMAALNDGVVKANPLPPQMWGSWTPDNPPQQWLQYSWAQPVTLDRTRIVFWADQPAGASIGVAPPAHWQLEFRQDGRWQPVQPKHSHDGPSSLDAAVSFAPVTTRCVRVMLDASGTEGQHAALAVQEWEVLAPQPQRLPTATAADAARCDAR
ncbi:family 43 glycosylhydrolase [Xanthomonas cucurbitae]|uniref:Family 43 glycosylhydrolase n=1 Tax=Xanthomonas cucurbitae TaxID=56453 RepID=A0A2S7DU66_9XANT|nr:family 43 glycosylhydrolase [Xanthomonas cucurbitae]PPU77336.1 glycosyl hydrolase family 43 [Xanthomonas cucurbitae]WDM66178.1 family 43 glycosylhydrolase [Xanthomonas cucurbitae]WDM70056.1 family 43 glycosylhydrolase [Xanthomonas cucurbitae]WDM80578.1 family 43 glycosylhydrolase [Xanthomonas cucurbitae]WDM84269.1 family 43 glycosylhydrolase [Xanthomonas cucurbitae]